MSKPDSIRNARPALKSRPVDSLNEIGLAMFPEMVERATSQQRLSLALSAPRIIEKISPDDNVAIGRFDR